MILVLILLVIVLIIIAVFFWYVTIPIIILFLIYIYRHKIHDYFYQKNLKKSIKKIARTQPKENNDSIKIKNIISALKISNYDTEVILGRDWEGLTTMSVFLERITMIGLDQNQLLSIPKHLIPKFSTLVQAIKENKQILGYSSDDKFGQLNKIINNCKYCYENYVKSKYEQNTTENNNSNKRDNSYQSNHYSNYKVNSVKIRLSKFNITEKEAEVIFGKNWYQKLGKLDFELYFIIKNIQLKIIYHDTRYLKQIGKIGRAHV